MKRAGLADAALIVLAFLGVYLTLSVALGDEQTTRRKRRQEAKEESTVAELSSRALTHRWATPTRIQRYSQEAIEDEREDEAVLALVEFESGRLGIYLARQRPSEDVWLTIAKKDLSFLAEALDRSKSR